MKTVFNILFVLLLFASISLPAQMCPGGGLNFNSAVTFDPAWVYGCNTGTSCNGGVNFDNRVACQPTTAMEACAPAPTCGTPSQHASNIWFKFYASHTNVTLSGYQNSSFVVGIQAFSGGPTCGSLTQIGCALAGGPSSGVSLNLSGLVVGELYYYRVFGSASAVSQRSGIYCFCGTTGVNSYVLPKGLSSFTGNAQQDRIQLKWKIPVSSESISFVVQSSSDGFVFYDVHTDQRRQNVTEYNYHVKAPNAGKFMYRLKMIDEKGNVEYSPVLTLNVQGTDEKWTVQVKANREVVVKSTESVQLTIFNSQGNAIRTYQLPRGGQQLQLQHLSPGVYFLREKQSSFSQKVVLY